MRELLEIQRQSLKEFESLILTTRTEQARAFVEGCIVTTKSILECLEKLS